MKLLRITVATVLMIFVVPFILSEARTALINHENAQHTWVTM